MLPAIPTTGYRGLAGGRPAGRSGRDRDPADPVGTSVLSKVRTNAGKQKPEPASGAQLSVPLQALNCATLRTTHPDSRTKTLIFGSLAKMSEVRRWNSVEPDAVDRIVKPPARYSFPAAPSPARIIAADELVAKSSLIETRDDNTDMNSGVAAAGPI